MDGPLEAPPTTEPFAQAGWDDILPCYERLAAAPPDAKNAEVRLAAWSRLVEAPADRSGLTAEPDGE